MTTGEKLHPWCIVLHRTKTQKVVVGRFHRFNDAMNHATTLQQFFPHFDYRVVYSPGTVSKQQNP